MTTQATPQFGLVGIVVRDMARSLAFYRQLGMDIPLEADQQPHADVTLPGGIWVAWDTVETIRSCDPGYQPPDGTGVSLGFRLPTAADVDATYERMVAAGYHGHKPPWDAFWGQRYALIRDPDGNGVDLLAPLS